MRADLRAPMCLKRMHAGGRFMYCGKPAKAKAVGDDRELPVCGVHATWYRKQGYEILDLKERQP